ncbi:MAG: RMD1 family protein [Oligoflexia bacterium]|nr:RMD1 family protein [Oligoflexia bacterium]
MKIYRVNAFHLTEKFKLKDIGNFLNIQPITLSVWEAAFKFSDESYFFLYNFGSAVFFNVAEENQKTILDKLKKVNLPQNPGYTTTDEFSVEVTGEGKHEVNFNKAIIHDLTYQKARLVSMVVAESAALEYFELIVDDLLERNHQISDSLRTKGKLIKETKQLIKFIGFCLTTKQEIIANLYVVDAPDEVWEDQVLDRLYGELKRMFEIETRYRVLEYKLKLIQESVEIIVDLSKSSREIMLEMTIIALIAIDIIIALVGGKFI